MKSVMELLFRKQNPEYTEEELWDEIMRFCDENSTEIDLALKQYQFMAVTEAFEEKRRETMSLLHAATDREMQWVFRFITNFETAILYLLGDEEIRTRIFWNLSRRLERLISGEAFTITEKMDLNEQLCEKVLQKVNNLMLSEDFPKESI